MSATPAREGRVWVLGGGGMLGQATLRALAARGYATVSSSSEVDVADAAAVAGFAAQHPCATWINCAAMTAVDACEDGREGAAKNDAVNARGPEVVAACAKEHGARILHVSTDYVFAGDATEPYREDHACAPKSAYGRAKLAGEEGLWRALGEAGAKLGYVVRTAWLFGPYGNNFVATMLRLMANRPQLQVVADQQGRPTYTLDLAAGMLDLLGLVDREGAAATATSGAPAGTYHLANAGATSWHGFAAAILAAAKQGGRALTCTEVQKTSSENFPRPAPRPAYSVLSTDKATAALGRPLRGWSEALGAYLASPESHNV